MKVLFLTKYYPPAEGGIERYGYMLCSDLVAGGDHVEVVAASEERAPSRQEAFDGVKIHRLDQQFNVSSTPVTLDLPRLLHAVVDDFDLIHINFPNPWTDLLYLALCQGRKVVLTYHSDIFRPARSLSGLLLRAYSPFIRWVLSRVTAIIVSSPNCVVSSPFLNPHRAKCRVIPMPVDVAEITQVDDNLVIEERERFGDFVFFLGRLVHYKGVRYLIEALDRVHDGVLVIGSDGPLEEELKNQVDRLGLGQRVHFLGRITDERRRALYHACRCFVLPSISHAEGFGIVLAEAMACGKPVISTQLQTGTSFVNLDGVTGYVVPPGDPVALAEKIEILLHDDEIYARMACKARERAESQFDRPIVVDKTRSLYEDILVKADESS